MIQAEAHSDDFRVEVRFDAEPHLREHPELLAALADCEWGGDYPADDLLRFARDANAEVERLLTYCETGDVGFECHVLDVEAAERMRA